MENHDIGDQNLERLLAQAYHPEPVDETFTRRVEERLVAEARSLAERRAIVVPFNPVARFRRRMGWLVGLAASLAAIGLYFYANTRPAVYLTDPRARAVLEDIRASFTNLPENWRHGLRPRALPSVREVKLVAVGETLTAAPGQRRRVTLADGSVAYLNHDTEAKQIAERKLTLERGEVYLEVAPHSGTGPSFVVHTPKGDVSAFGTRFAVKATNEGPGVVVTQGTVKVQGMEVQAGQEIAPGARDIQPSPRASHLLDWTRELMAAAETPLVPCSKHQGGALVAIDPNGQEVNLTLRKYHIDVHIEDGFARTTIDQTYFNNLWSRTEGTFYFPLPPDASLSRLAMYVDESSGQCRLMEGGMAERDHARNVYETILHQRRDPALLEWVDGNTFKMRVFPLEGRREKRIILSYTQRLGSTYDVTRYRFPAGHNLGVVRDWSFEARIKKGADVQASSASHPEMFNGLEKTDRVLRTSAHDIKLDKDVTLELKPVVQAARLHAAEPAALREQARFATMLHDNQQFLLVRFRPELKSPAKKERRDWIVIFESSADRDPLVGRAQVEVLRHLFLNAEKDDTLSILTAGSRVHFWNTEAKPLTRANLEDAVRFLEGSHLVGALDLSAAFTAAADFWKSAKNPHVLHVGAGLPAMGQTRHEELIKQIPHDVRYVGVGVGKRWNRTLMKQLAEQTGGWFTQINPDEPLAWRAFDLLATLNTPRLLNVRVIDPAEKINYLADTTLIAQGEEICAVGRFQGNLPEKVIVAGKHDGQSYVREFKVENVAENAGALPRHWAKLEIDRLIADGAEKNQKTITELSKASYVMSPFTSLLVLETDADYERFKVDRGRKDHWAMYDCPLKIPSVYDPGQGPPPVEAKNKEKSKTEQALDSVLVHLGPQMLSHGYWRDWQWAVTAKQWLQGVVAAQWSVPVISDEADEWGNIDLATRTERQFRIYKSLMNTARMEETEAGARLARARLLLRRQGQKDLAGTYRLELLEEERLEQRLGLLQGLDPREGLLDLGRKARWMDYYGYMISLREKGKDGKARAGVRRFDWDENIILNGSRDFNSIEFFPPALALTVKGKQHLKRIAGGIVDGKFRRAEAEWLEAQWRGLPIITNESYSRPFITDTLDLYDRNFDGLMVYRGLSKEDGGWGYIPYFRTILDRKSKDKGSGSGGFGGQGPPHRRRAMLRDLTLGDLWDIPPWNTTLTYRRPQFHNHWRIYSDLLSYAPGLNTSWADIQAVLDKEARGEPVKRGTIDEAARARIDESRSGPWFQIVVPGHARWPSYKVLFNGQGQFAWERLTEHGLKEQVMCDGTHLYHLYPEIGLGGKRAFNRFQQHLIAGFVPWLVPSADDLAIGCDVKLVAKDTVALIPLGEAPKDDKGKPLPTWQIHLVFADGRLAERRLVEQPGDKLLAKVSYDSQGKITLADGEGKAIAEEKLTVAEAEAPSLQPKTDELVMLPMPIRSAEHNLGGKGWTGTSKHLSEEQATALFATECLRGDFQRALVIRGERWSEQPVKLGMLTLLNTTGTWLQYYQNNYKELQKQHKDLKLAPINLDDPAFKTPLGKFLLHQQRYLANASTMTEELPGAGFIQDLARFQNLMLAFSDPRSHLSNAMQAEVQRGHAKKFLETTRSPLFAYAVTDALVRGETPTKDVHPIQKNYQTLAAAVKDFGEIGALGYYLRYENARSLWNDPATKPQAKEPFRKLVEESFAAGTLPALDSAFREALGADFSPAVRKAHEELLKDKLYDAALAMAWQTKELGDVFTADAMFQRVLDTVPEDDRLWVQMQVVEFYSKTAQPQRADELFQKVVADKLIAELPAAWRYASKLAGERKQLARAAAALEKALDMEFKDLPELVNLEKFRGDYRALLTQYQQLADALAMAEAIPPKDFSIRVIKAADRWRNLDPDNAEVCTLAAKLLRTLGQHELAWDYLTTPIARKPNEASGWLAMAQTLKQEGNLPLADRAYIQAFNAEATNPQILWDRAQNLQQMGRLPEARNLYRQIADGQWQDRFNQLKQQAQALGIRD